MQKLSADWDRLFQADPRLDVFQDFAWAKLWWHSFGSRYRLCAGIARESGRVVGILPLALDGRTIRFLGHSSSDYNTILAEPGYEAAGLAGIFEALLDWRSGWDRLLLENVPADGTLSRAVEEMRDGFRSHISVRKTEPCPVLLLGEQRAERIAGILQKDKLRKMARHLGRLGELQFHRITPEESAAHLETFARQHARRSVMMGRMSAFRRDDMLAFYHAMLHEPAFAGKTHFSVLEAGGAPLAYHFGFCCKRKFLYFKPTFDIDIRDLSPGQVLLCYLLEEVERLDVAEFDFGQGGEAYKYRFANEVRHNLQIEMFARSVRAGLAKVRLRATERAKSAVRSRPALDSYLRNLTGSPGPNAPVRLPGRVREFAYSTTTTVLGRLAGASEPRGAEPVDGRPATLAQLADLACEFGAAITYVRLQEARDRFKQKQTAFVLRIADRPRHIVWVGTATGIPLPNGGATKQLNSEAKIVFAWWTLPGGETSYSAALNWLRSQASQEGLEAWAFLPEKAAHFAARLPVSGFEPELRLTALCRWGKTSWTARKVAAGGNAA